MSFVMSGMSWKDGQDLSKNLKSPIKLVVGVGGEIDYEQSGAETGRQFWENVRGELGSDSSESIDAIINAAESGTFDKYHSTRMGTPEGSYNYEQSFKDYKAGDWTIGHRSRNKLWESNRIANTPQNAGHRDALSSSRDRGGTGHRGGLRLGAPNTGGTTSTRRGDQSNYGFGDSTDLTQFGRGRGDIWSSLRPSMTW